MKKKILFSVLCSSLIVLLVSLLHLRILDWTIEARAETEYKGLAFYLINNDSEYSVCSDGTEVDELVIPEQFNGKPVTEIMNAGFLGCESLTSVEIPETVIRIDDFAFSDCINLTDVYIATDMQNGLGVRVIGDGAFAYCNLQSPIIPNTVTEDGMGDGVFDGNPETGSLYIRRAQAPALWSSLMDDYAGEIVYGEDNLVFREEINSEGLVYAYSVKQFQNIGTKGNLIVPCHYNGLPVINILQRAFSGCDLSEICLETECVHGLEVPNINIETMAFNNAKVDSIVLHDGVTFYNTLKTPTIAAKNVFVRSSVQTVTLPNNLTGISQGMFSDCSALTTIYTSDTEPNHLPTTVTELGATAFKGCINLEVLYVPSTVTKIGSNVFAAWTPNQTIRFGHDMLPDNWRGVNWNGGNARIKWEKLTITFITNAPNTAENSYTVYVDSDSTLQDIIDQVVLPTSESHQHTGKWYRDSEQTDEFNLSDHFNDDSTLFAGWEIKNFLLDFRFADILEYSVSLTDGVSCNHETYRVEYNGRLTFTVSPTVAYAHSDSQIIIKANGKEIVRNGGVYILPNIVEDQTITVEPMEKNRYMITVDASPYVEFSPTESVIAHYGDTYTIHAVAKPLYDLSLPIIKVNGDTITLDSEGYFALFVDQDFRITADPLPLNKYDILFDDSPYVSYIPNGNVKIPYGGSYTFTVVTNSAYDASQPTVRVNGNPLACNADGEYVLTNITETKRITTDAMPKNQYRVIFETSDYVEYIHDALTIEYGESYTFKVIAKRPYNQTVPQIKINGRVAAIDSQGCITLDSVITDQIIVALPLPLNRYNVQFAMSDYIEYAYGNPLVEHGSNFTFRAVVKPAYDNATPIIRVNGKIIEPEKDGTYIIYNICQTQSVTADALPRNFYSISFMNENEGREITKFYGEEITHDEFPVDFVKIGHWYDTYTYYQNGIYKRYNFQTDTESILVDGDITFQVDWEKNRYMIHFESNGSVGAVADSIAYYGDSIILPIPKYEFYDYFIGWYYDRDWLNPVDSDCFVFDGINGDTVTLYANVDKPIQPHSSVLQYKRTIQYLSISSNYKEYTISPDCEEAIFKERQLSATRRFSITIAARTKPLTLILWDVEIVHEESVLICQSNIELTIHVEGKCTVTSSGYLNIEYKRNQVGPDAIYAPNASIIFAGKGVLEVTGGIGGGGLPGEMGARGIDGRDGSLFVTSQPGGTGEDGKSGGAGMPGGAAVNARSVRSYNESRIVLTGGKGGTGGTGGHGGYGGHGGNGLVGNGKPGGAGGKGGTGGTGGPGGVAVKGSWTNQAAMHLYQGKQGRGGDGGHGGYGGYGGKNAANDGCGATGANGEGGAGGVGDPNGLPGGSD